MLRSLAKSESGVTALEYGLAAALIGIAIIVSVLAVGGHLNEDFTYIASSFEPGEEGAGQAPPASGAGGSGAGAGGSASNGGGSGGSGSGSGSGSDLGGSGSGSAGGGSSGGGGASSDSGGIGSSAPGGGSNSGNSGSNSSDTGLGDSGAGGDDSASSGGGSGTSSGGADSSAGGGNSASPGGGTGTSGSAASSASARSMSPSGSSGSGFSGGGGSAGPIGATADTGGNNTGLRGPGRGFAVASRGDRFGRRVERHGNPSGAGTGPDGDEYAGLGESSTDTEQAEIEEPPIPNDPTVDPLEKDAQDGVASGAPYRVGGGGSTKQTKPSRSFWEVYEDNETSFNLTVLVFGLLLTVFFMVRSFSTGGGGAGRGGSSPEGRVARADARRAQERHGVFSSHKKAA